MRKLMPTATFAELYIECALGSGVTLQECDLGNGQVRPYSIYPEKFEPVDRLLYACNYAIRGRWPTPPFDVLYGPPSHEGMMFAQVMARKLSGMVLNRYTRQVRPLDNVLLISDTITDGKEEEGAIQSIKTCGGNPLGLCVVFDQQERMGGVQEFEQKHDIPIVAAATFEDLIHVLSRKQNMGKILKKMATYRRRYCVC